MTFRFELPQRSSNRMKHKSVQAVETIAFQILYSSVDIVPQHENITVRIRPHSGFQRKIYTAVQYRCHLSPPGVHTSVTVRK